jgi:predicted kinase
LFDAIEFNPVFAEIDTFYDLAFLLMDLEARGLRRLASIVLNRYLDVAGDEDAIALLPLFLSLRTQIRAHVTAAAAAHQSDSDKIESQRQDVRRYFDTAMHCLAGEAPRVIAVGGLSGTGKSRLARALAPYLGPSPGARVVRTDVIRKRLAGVSMFERLDPSFYSQTMTERTYRTCYEQVRRVIDAGHAAIMDAVFSREEERHAIAAVAGDAGVPFQGLWLEADPETLESRVRDRERNVSDATVDVLHRQLGYELGAIQWPRIDSSGRRRDTLKAALHVIGVHKG